MFVEGRCYPHGEARVKRLKVLLLEDEVIIGMDIEAFLWDQGFEVMLPRTALLQSSGCRNRRPMSLFWMCN